MASPAKGMKRKAKDTGKPKKPTSSYFYFLEECRRKAKEEGRSLSKIAEFTRECSATWKDITATEKKKFEDKAAADKKRYQKEMESYVPTDDDDVKATKKSKKVKDENKPKRPQSAYFLFLADFRKKMKGKDIENRELLKQAGVEWGKLSKDQKKPFEKLSEVEKGKYDAAMAIYNKVGSKPATAKKSAPAANGTDDDEDDDEEEEDEEDDVDEESDE
ncbi:hypothetical protein LOTGIDRAFT_134831 [Lottia gigantea]|uniref:HMG box domain-containing protein n=1 Tax=Lottia gigantea TaxID=225164 RepID=V3YWG6_LOTGI|nr:hypothetical protein LOTGIDRAFT_134831 [Lottia gigantea]ESO82338.1 hypothetical protein LOTGIDRAFT_134831 [Lottia gigantea]